MSTVVISHEIEAIPFSHRGPAPKRVVIGFGFWLFLLSDIVIFGALFAAYAVLSKATADGPGGPELFDKSRVLLETTLLLASSFTCGLLAVALGRLRVGYVYLFAALTLILGTGFIGLEIKEFATMVATGAGPSKSAFLSAFFALVGTHGLHVGVGMLWLIVMLAQIATLGLHEKVLNRMLCFSLFWHALDIVWVGVFTIVYLGAR